MRLILLLLALAGCFPHTASETPRPVLQGAETPVDLYWPEAEGPAPLIVVVHGFARSRHRMRGWGRALADRGYAVAVPTLPTLGKHQQNARAVVELVEGLRGRHPDRIDPEQTVLVGFSAGGLATALASPLIDVDLWIGLDPVDSGGLATDRAHLFGVPGVALRAEPHACNASGNSRELMDRWDGPTFTVKIRGATHCDPEWPSDVPCALACGEPAGDRQQAYRDLVFDLVDGALRCDEGAIARVALAGSDARLMFREDHHFVSWLEGHCAGVIR